MRAGNARVRSRSRSSSLSETYTSIRRHGNHVNAKARLFCFPHAGGSAYAYAEWEKYFGEEVELYALETPARLHNSGNGSIEGLEDFVDAILPSLESLCDLPFCFFGHSAGATVAYYTAQVLASRGLPVPALIVASGDTSPYHPGWAKSYEALTQLTPEETTAQLLEWGGLPQEFVEDPTARDFAVSLFRKDVEIVASYTTARHRTLKLSSNVLILGGEADEASPFQEAQHWKEGVTGTLSSRCFPGGHFYWMDDNAAKEEANMKELGSFITTALRDTVETSRAEAANLVREWNTTEVMEYPCEKLLHELFMEQAAATPDAVAVVDGTTGKSLTFKQVDEQTDLLARRLHREGVGPDKPVGILMERCAEFVLSYIAALKAGGAYMPLEVVYPADLLGRVCEAAEPVVVMTKPAFVEKLPSTQKSFVFDDGWLTALESSPPPPMPADRELPNPLSLAYIVMSSGTTGVPKGICCPHRGAVYSYHWRHEHYPFVEGDRVACNVFFVWECLRPLLRGYPTYIIPDNVIYDPTRLVPFLNENKITRILFTPSLLQLVLDSFPSEELASKLSCLRIAWLCGEVVTMELRERCRVALPKTSLLNLYSISECHDVSVADLYDVDSTAHPKFAPCGRPMANVKVFILDDELNVVPKGCPGEVYVSGPCVARGYLKRPDITSQRFLKVPDHLLPLMEYDKDKLPAFTQNKWFDSEVRMYRTGDRGKFMPDGTLELVGRCDFMVKIRGYSVVLGAVEAAISSHPMISTAVAITDGQEGEDKRLVAYIVPEDWDAPPVATSKLREFLSKKLPHYAIPSVIIALQSLPVNDATGKLDRKKLPKPSEGEEPQGGSAAGEESKEEMDGVAQHLCQLWEKCLRCDKSVITKKVTFYEAGGHSLLMARLSSLVGAEFNIPFTVSDVANASSFGAMASLIRQRLSISEPGEAEPTDTANSDPLLKGLRDVWARLLRCSPSSLHPSDRFFEVGGHSLLLARLSAAIKDHFAVDMSISDITAHATLTAMAAQIRQRSGGAAPEEDDSKDRNEEGQAYAEATGVTHMLEDDAALDPTIYPAATRKTGYSRLRMREASRPPRRVLLTGVTGYLGAHLLSSLLRDTDVDAYCLVRAGSPEAAFDRILETLTAYNLWLPSDSEGKEGDKAAAPSANGVDKSPGHPMPLDAHSVGWTGDAHEELNTPDVDSTPPPFRKKDHGKAADREDEWLHRIVPVCGDLSRPALGLAHDNFRHLAGQVDAIIHNGAEVNLVKSYKDLRNTNVLGTQEVLRLAVTNGVFDWNATRVKPVHFVSTNGVFQTSRTTVKESDVEDAPGKLPDGYAQSKWVAEELVRIAAERGLPVSIFRPGNLFSSSATGKSNAKDFVLLLMHGCLLLNAVPKNTNWRFDLTPVDFAAQALVHLAVLNPMQCVGNIFHLQSPHSHISAEDFFAMMCSSAAAKGHSMKQVALPEWRQLLHAAVEKQGTDTPNGLVLARLAAGLPAFEEYLRNPFEFSADALVKSLDRTQNWGRSQTPPRCPQIGDAFVDAVLKQLY